MSAHLARARLLFERDRFAEARQELHWALQESPDDPEALALLALASAALNEIPEALRVIQQAIGLHPDNSGLHFVHSNILLSANKIKAALAALQEAIRLNPRDPDHFSLLAKINLVLNREKEAQHATDSALQIDPEHVEALNLRVLTLARQGKAKDAAETAQRVLQIAPDDSLSHAALGWSNLQQGKPTQALANFGEALRLDPTSELSREGMIEALKSRYLFHRVTMRLLRWYGRNRVLQVLFVISGILYFPLAFFGFFRFFFLSSFTNILLLCNRHGRLILNKEETRDTIILVIPLAFALLGLLLGIASIKSGISLIFPGIVSSLSLALALSLGSWQRILLFIGSAVIVLLSFGGALLIISSIPSLLETGKTMQGWSSLAFFATWLLYAGFSRANTSS